MVHRLAPVVFTRYVYMADYSDAGLLSTEKVPAMREVNALAAGSWDADLVPAPARSSSTRRGPVRSTAPGWSRS